MPEPPSVALPLPVTWPRHQPFEPGAPHESESVSEGATLSILKLADVDAELPALSVADVVTVCEPCVVTEFAPAGVLVVDAFGVAFDDPPLLQAESNATSAIVPKTALHVPRGDRAHIRVRVVIATILGAHQGGG